MQELRGLIAMPGLVRAQTVDAIKISLEFRIYGGNAPMFFAAENGIFKQSRARRDLRRLVGFR